MVRKCDSGGNKRFSRCADVLSGGGRDAGLFVDEMGRQSAPKMVLSVFSAHNTVDDAIFDIVRRDAVADNER